MAAEFSSTDLVKALRKQVTVLEDDLRARVDGVDVDARQPEVGERWRAEHTAALKAQRTAASWQAWRDERVTQAAVAWVLLTVFARYSEDHALVSKAWIGGPDADSRQQALDARRAYFTAHPEHTDREWLGEIIEHFAKFEATRGLVDAYSPLHQVAPSGDAARAILEFWWDKDASGSLFWSFVGVDTRFLGDVYQDLSEFAKKTYALLQTPEFVEEFILDQTLEPALAERPLEGFTVIDPTCGSGHFLLGAFHRLLERWQREAPAMGPRALVSKALASVYGVDINPFAVAIARFRLMVAALDASGDKSIEKLIDIELNLAAGDSLLWGSRHEAMSDDLLSIGQGEFALSIEDADALKRILRREHDVVVGNPPYISVKDAALRNLYRRHYSTCHGKYVLSVPFMELFFDLAKVGEGCPAGWIGQITSNSFMKREFGTKLIEEFLWMRDLRFLIDSEGAWIPGHNSDGTPTVVVIGRGGDARRSTVRAALSKGRREGPEWGNCGGGPFWQSIVKNLEDPGFENEWLSIADIPRETLREHPWSLSGGGALELVAAIEAVNSRRLDRLASSVGITSFTLEDDVFIQPRDSAERVLAGESVRETVAGDEVRDWGQMPHEYAIWPYDSEYVVVPLESIPATTRFMWPYREQLANSKMFGNQTKVAAGLKWYEFGRLTAGKLRTPLTITFAEIASHNHFVLDRGGKVFKQTAPVIKLPEGASEDDHLRLVGVLNTSVVCFWLRDKCKPKGGAAKHIWSRTYQFNATKVQKLPLPSSLPLTHASALDALSQELAAHNPSTVAAMTVPTDQALGEARNESERIRARMIANQEELDWECYRLYGLIAEDLTYSGELPGIALGERAFEIILARGVESDEQTEWFSRHHSVPVAEIPRHLPAKYRTLMQRRLDVIATNPGIRLLEKPEYKRRWESEPWDKRVTEALRIWLIDRVEDRALWFTDGHSVPQSIDQLADKLDRDEDFRSVLRLWAENPDVSTGAALGKLLEGEDVPYLASLRYKPSGLEKRAAWEYTWDLQRREDAGETLETPIPVPPAYKSEDFLQGSYWSRRGKLDVPKERFVSYPGVSRDNDTSALLGWAGWDYAEQALALAGLVDDRIDKDGWDQSSPDKLVPMLAGLSELAPWVRQWHGEIDPEFGESVADTIDEVLRSRSAELGVTADQLAAWRPPTTTRARSASKKTEGE